MLFSDTNSICNQLIFATKHLRICRLIEWCSNQDTSCFKNPELKLFAELGFISTHSIYVRGLAFGDQKNEISLRQILCLVFTNRALVTRENYVCFNEVPYEYEDALQEERRNLFEQLESTPFIFADLSPAEKSKRRHIIFDVISKVQKNERNPEDLINQGFFQLLEDELDKCSNTDTFANYMVAHRQLEEIRKIQEAKDKQKMQIRIDSLVENYASLWKVFNTLTNYFFDSCYDPILSLTHQFAVIEEPMVDSKKIKEYEELAEQLKEKDRFRYSQRLRFD